jgi:hypothetical protein
MSKIHEWNFNQNLLHLSENTELELAKQEWVMICREDRDEMDRLCICQHKIKKVTYMYNQNTCHVITVGSTCVDHFPLMEDKMKPDIFQQFMKEFLLKGEYGTIENIFDYSQIVQQQLVDHFEKKMQTENLHILETLCSELRDIISRHKLVHLQDILDQVETKLVRLRHEEIEKKKQREIELARQEERAKLQKQEKEKTQQQEMERFRKDTEQRMAQAARRRWESEEVHRQKMQSEYWQREQERRKRSIELEKLRMQNEKHKETMQPVVLFEGIPIPQEWLTTQPLYLEYIAEITPMQRKALHIAMIHLKTSFDLARSNGFVEWLAKRVAPSAESR